MIKIPQSRKDIKSNIRQAILKNLADALYVMAEKNGERSKEAYEFLQDRGILPKNESESKSALGHAIDALLLIDYEDDIAEIYRYLNSRQKYYAFFKNVKSYQFLSDDIILWIKSKPLINVSKLEREAGCPSGTISQCISNSGRNISFAHIDRIIMVLKNYGYETQLNENTYNRK